MVNTKYNCSNWTCHKRILKNIPRTINLVEGWHRVLNERCVVSLPNIVGLVNVLKDFEEENRFTLCQFKKNFKPCNEKDLKREYKI
jgi:hypothetical protein